MNLQKWMEMCGHRITEASEYQWQCYGTESHSLSSWNGDYDGYSTDIVFDRITQTVYEFSVCDYSGNTAGRWINPDYRYKHKQYVAQNGGHSDDAWDGVPYVEFDSADMLIDRYHSIVQDHSPATVPSAPEVEVQMPQPDSDGRVSVEIDIDDETFLKLARRAHEQDITINKMVENLLWAEIQRNRDTESVDTDSDPWEDSYASDR